MRETIRKLGTFGDVTASGVLVAATAVVNFFGMLILARGLGPVPFGVYSTSRRVVAFVAPFVSLGGHLGVSRFLGFHAGDAKRRSAVLVLGTILCLVTLPITAALFALLGETASKISWIGDLEHEIWIATILLTAATATGLVVFSTLRGFGHPQMANLHQLTVLSSLLGIAAITWGSPVGRILLLFAGSTAAINTGYFAWVLWEHRVEFIVPKRSELRGAVREVAPYSMSRLADGPLQASLSLVGILLAPGIGGMALSGYIHISQTLVRMSEMLIVPLSVIFLPLVARQVREGQIERLQRQAQMIFDSVVLVSSFLVVQGLIWARPLLLSAFGTKYEGATPFLMVTIPSMLPFLMFAGFRSFIDGYSVRPMNSLNLFVAALVVVGSSVGMGKFQNGVGLSLSYTLGMIVLGTLSVIYVTRHFGTQVLTRHTLSAFTMALGLGLLSRPLAEVSKNLSPVPTFLLFVIAEVALSGGLVWVALKLRHPTMVYAKERIRAARGSGGTGTASLETGQENTEASDGNPCADSDRETVEAPQAAKRNHAVRRE